MRAFSYAWLLPVTQQKWRSHHSIGRSRKSMLHVNFMTIKLCCIAPELLPTEVLHCGNRNFIDHSLPTTLTLTKWLSYTNLTHIPWRYIGCAKINFLCQRLSKVIVLQLANARTWSSVVTSGHVIKMAVTTFDPP